MNFEPVNMDRYPFVLNLFKKVKKDLNKQKNDQWKWIYPNRSIYKADLKNGNMYGMLDGNELVAVVTLDDMQSDHYQTLEWSDKGGKPCCIHRLAVHPDHQGKGLGKQLLQHIENWAIQKGYTSVRIDVYQVNETAKVLYAKNGYEERGEVRYPLRKHSYISMEKRLDGGAVL